MKKTNDTKVVRSSVRHLERTVLCLVMTLVACTSLRAQDDASPGPSLGDKPAVAATEWSVTDTKLANHYLGLLQSQPEYGEVLELLWQLYLKRDSTALLLDYIGKAAADDAEGTAKLLHAHLLRKNGDDEAAAARYSEVLDLQSENVHALRGAAELFEAAGKSAKALSYYNRLIPLLPMPDRLGADMRMRKATMLKESGDLDGAVELWFEVLEAFPTDLGMRTEVVGLLLEANRVEGAVLILRELAKTDDPELKVSALKRLNRLYEFVGDFDNAAAVAREGMDLAHYKHHEHADFFARLVRLHERFGRLPELEKTLIAEAQAVSPTEQAVYAVVEFYRLTANTREQENWLVRLVELAPVNPAYRVELADTQIDNDHYEAAAATVDALLAKDDGAGTEPPLPLLLLRARIEIHLHGKAAAAEQIQRYVEQGQPTAESLRKVLAFCREQYLDGVVESLLRGPMASDEFAGKDDAPSAVRLAAFLRERGKLKQAREVLEKFIEEADGDERRKARRLEQVAAAYREMDMLDEARGAIAAAIVLLPDRLDLLVQRAEVEVALGDIDAALVSYQLVWRRSETIADKTEIDQRLFSLLRGLPEKDSPNGTPLNSLPPPPPLGSSPAAMADYRRKMNAVAAVQATGGAGFGDEPMPQELVDFYSGIKTVAEKEPTVANRYRVAWWAFRQQDHQEMYSQLAGLHDPDKPVIEAERLMLELAEQTENTLLIARQLELLAKVDLENQAEYRHRWAEVRFKLGYEDEAVRLLEELARDPEATLGVLKTLASVYQQQGRKNDQVEVWRRSYRQGNVFEKRRVIKQLTNTLVELGRPSDALDVLMDLIGHETDIVQKRKHFDSQLSLATRQYLPGELLEMYRGAAQQEPFERFYPEALARIHRSMGDPDAAFAAMKKAYYMSGEDRELLAELGQMAGETSDLKAAIYYRRQLIAQDEEETDVDGWKSLIGMLERDLRVADADRIRERLEGKFGQDADFLKSLADYYRGSGQHDAAIRVLEELVRLRAWDAAAQLELGLLRRERGDLVGAMESFEQVIAETAEAALSPAERDFEYLPVVDGGWFSGIGERPDEGGLTSYVRALQDYRFLPLELQERLMERYRRPHPEFHRVPRGDAFLRLRAIEEAAGLVAIGVGAGPGQAGKNAVNDEQRTQISGPTAAEIADGRDRWVRRWDRPGEISPTEKLWAFYHCGDLLRAHRLLRETMLPVSRPADQLDYLLLSLRMNRAEAVIDWMAEQKTVLEQVDRHALIDGVGGVGRADTMQKLELGAMANPVDRGTLPLVAMFLLMQDEENAQLLSEATLHQVLSELIVSQRVTHHMIDQLVQDAHTLPAFRLARATIELRPQAARPADYYRVAKLAQWLGLDEERRKALDQALESMELRSATDRRYGQAALGETWSLPTSYYQVAAELLSLVEKPAERDAMRERLLERVTSHPANSPKLRAEAETLLAFAAGDAAAGSEALGRWMEMESKAAQPQQPFDGDMDQRRMSLWRETASQMNQLAAFLPANASRPAFDAAFAPLDQRVSSGDKNVDDEYAQFQIARFALLMEGMPAPRRRLAEQLFEQRLGDITQRLELVHTLESREFYADVVPIYERLIREEPEDFTLVRSFFVACREAGEYPAALELLSGYLAGELPRAQGMNDGYLIGEHAYFLEQARDRETLASYASTSSKPKPDAASVPATVDSFEPGAAALDWSSQYHAALARVHEAQGDPEAALRVYLHLRQQGFLELDSRVRAVDLLIGKGDLNQAREWLDGVSFDRVAPGVEAEALRRLVTLNANAGQRNVERLGELARTALDFGQSDVIADVASTLHSASLRTEAESLLLLRARQAVNSGSGLGVIPAKQQQRCKLLLKLAELRLAVQDENDGKGSFSAVEDVAELLFESLRSDDPSALAWLEIVGRQVAAHPGEWREGLEKIASRQAQRNRDMALPAIVLSSARSRGLIDADSAPLDLARVLAARADGGDFSPDPLAWSTAGQELAATVLIIPVEAGEELSAKPQENWIAVLREALADETRGATPHQFDSVGALARRLRALSRLGMKNELAELHRRLLLETAANGLDRRMAVDQMPVFELRWQLPRVLADSGETELATELYQRYYDSIARLTREHRGFVSDYARFLMERSDWLGAEVVLKRLFHKSLNAEPTLLVDWALHSGAVAAGDGAGIFDSVMRRFSLSPALSLQVAEIAAQQAASAGAEDGAETKSRKN